MYGVGDRFRLRIVNPGEPQTRWHRHLAAPPSLGQQAWKLAAMATDQAGPRGSVAMIEAMFGVLYNAILMARLVGLYLQLSGLTP